MSEHLLILSEHADRYRALLEKQLPDLTLTACTCPEAALSEARDCALVLGDPDLVSQVLAELPGVRWVQSTWAGVTPLIERPERHYRLTNVKGVFGPLMSEYVFAHLLAHERRLVELRQAQAERHWQPLPPGRLQGRTLGLLGLGSIGLHLAATARHFGLRTWGCARTPAPHPDLDALFGPDQLSALVAGVDYLVASLPSTPHTRNLLDAEVLARFRPGALLINVGRGDLIDDPALVAALESGRLGGAVLDVFREEPLPEDHPFWRTRNLLITAHTAAPSFPEEIVPIFVENYRRYRRGEALQYEVDFRRGY